MAKVNVNPPQFTAQEIKRFWNYVDKSLGHGPEGTCWRWTRAVSANGYGRFGNLKQGCSTHRLAFYLANNYWPVNLVCHSCDWKRCCNPAHLFEGTCQDNLSDMVNKGRNRRGESASWSKLTENEVKEIRANYQGRYGEAIVMARRYNVSRQTIWKIVKRVDWRHV